MGPQHNCHENIFWSIIGLSCRHLSCALRNSPFCPPLVLLSQIPPFLYDRNYFHRTTVVRPPSMISNSRNSIWSRPAPETTNGTHMVVTYNGRDIFLFIYCSSCNQWHMPVEGGHMGSHHEEFLNGDVCLPVSQMAWQVYYKINLFYGITVPIAPVHWNVPPHANIHEQVNMLHDTSLS